jgi:tetratricopeptide (TPR) repeat protein
MLAYLQQDDRDVIVANSLVRLLSACPDERKWPGILRLLQEDPSPLIRASAAAGLEGYLTPETVEALVHAAGDKFRLVRVRAAASLAGVPPDYLEEQDRQAVEQALEEFIASILARPDDYTSHYNLGNLYMDVQDFEAAVAAYDTSSRLRPDFVPSLVNVSFALNAIGQNARAEERLRKALELEPESAVVNLNLGLLLGEQGRVEEAEAALRNVMQADPESAVTAYNLGIILTKNRPEEAITWVQKSVELRPEEPKYAYTLAYFLRQHGDTDEAIRLLRELLHEHPEYGDAYGLLGHLYEELGQVENAKAVYQQALEVESLLPRYKSFLMERLNALSSN